MFIPISYLTSGQLRTNITENRRVLIKGIATIGISVAVLGVILLLYLNLLQISTKFYGTADMSVIIHSQTAPEDIETIRTQLKTFPGVRELAYLNEDQVYKTLGLDASGANISAQYLPSALTFRLDSSNFADTAERIAKVLKPLQGVVAVLKPQDTAESILHFFKLIELLSLILLIFLAISIYFICGNIISVVAYSQRHTISVQKHLGASWRFICMPYILQGIGVALLGYALALVFVFMVYHMTTSTIIANIGQTTIGAELLFYSGAQLLIGSALVSVLCSFSALSSSTRVIRELKV